MPSETYELAEIEAEVASSSKKELEESVENWRKFIYYAKQVAPEILTSELLERAEAAQLNLEMAKVEVELSEKKIFDTIRADLKDKNLATIDINKLTQADKGRRIVLLRSRTEMIGKVVDWIPETGKLILRFNERVYKKGIVITKADKVRWAD
jgi:hypothetical protein